MKSSKLSAFFRDLTADPRQKMILLFGIEGILLQFVSSVNGFGNNLYATNMGATDTQIGFIQMVPNLVAVVLLLPAGIIGDRVRSSKTIPMVLTSFMGVMYLFYGTVPAMGPGRMGFFYVFLGLTAGIMSIYNAQWQNFFGDATHPAERNDVYTFRNRVMNLAGTIVPLICGSIMSAMPNSDSKLLVLRIFYYISSGFLFFQSWILSRIPSRQKEENEATKPKAPRFSPKDVIQAIVSAWNHKPFRSFFIIIIFFYLSWHIDWTTWYLTQINYMGMNESHLSISNAVQCVVTLISIGFFARLNNRRGVHFTMPIAVFGLALSCVAVVVCMQLPIAARPWSFIILSAIPVVPQSGLSLCMVQMLLDAVPSKNRALIISLYTMIVTLSNSLMPLVGVECYKLLGGNAAAMTLFYGLNFFWRCLDTLLFTLRYKKMKREGLLHPAVQSET